MQQFKSRTLHCRNSFEFFSFVLIKKLLFNGVFISCRVLQSPASGNVSLLCRQLPRGLPWQCYTGSGPVTGNTEGTSQLKFRNGPSHSQEWSL